MEVQVFGVKKSSETRAALRFFAERRIKAHFVDLNERPASPSLYCFACPSCAINSSAPSAPRTRPGEPGSPWPGSQPNFL